MSLKVIERLVTICGETHLAGIPCALIRFAGCDLDCDWCDTAYARDAALGNEMSVDELVAWVASRGLTLALLTGGEPLLQPELPTLAAALARDGVAVLVETSGAHDIRPLASPVIRSVDLKCPGSGEVDRILWSNLDHLRPGDAVKLVLRDRRDYDFAKEVIRRHRLGAPVHVLLSSAHPHLTPQELACWILEDRLSDVRLNPQLHRVLWPAGPEGHRTDHKEDA
jgi:7-carboxy-7-deazaguanine synthase